MKIKPIYALLLLCFFSCSDGEQLDMENDLIETMKDTSQTVSISIEVLDEMLQTLPSPIETANLITQTKSTFHKEMLIPASNADQFNDKYSQALALGGYGVDLGYLNLKGKMIYVAQYLESIHTISKALNVNQFLNISTLSELAANQNNVDSLIRISTENFNSIDQYLRLRKRGDLSVLILIGAWIEGLHMFNQIAAETPSEEIHKRIGEQKIIMDNIFAILTKIDHIKYYHDLHDKLKPLKAIYSKVKVVYEYKEPEMKEVNGELVIIDQSTSTIDIQKQELIDIKNEIGSLRTHVFGKCN